MRKTLAILLLCALAVPFANARTALVVDRSILQTKGGSAGLVENPGKAANVTGLGAAVVQYFLNAFNPGSFDVYRPEQLQTSNIANGTVNTLTGVKSYDQVLWVSRRTYVDAVNGGGEGAITTPVGCWPCSLTLVRADTTKIPRVPQVFVESGISEANFNTYAAQACSTGVWGEATDPVRQFAGTPSTLVHLLGTDIAWAEPYGLRPGILNTKRSLPAAPQGVVTDTSAASSQVYQPVDGGYRVVLGAQASAWNYYADSLNDRHPAWRDSMYAVRDINTLRDNLATNGPQGATYPGYGINGSWGHYVGWYPFNCEGMYLAMNYNGGPKRNMYAYGPPPDSLPNAPNIYAHWISGSPNDITLTSGTAWTRLVGSPSILYCAMALEDSLNGRKLLGSGNVRRGAVQVHGVCSRGNAYGPHGTAPYDSTLYYRGIDSLCALGIPIVPLVRMDSVATYQSELNYWLSKPNVYFGVERWSGTARTLKGALDSLTAWVGSARVDRVLGGSLSDISYTEFGTGATSAAVQNPDSMAYYFTKAGYRGVSQDAEGDSAFFAPVTADTILGLPQAKPYWFAKQGVMKLKSGATLMRLTYPGFNPRGATNGTGREGFLTRTSVGYVTANDSTFNSHYAERTMWGLFTPWWYNPYVFAERSTVTGGLQVAEPALTGSISTRVTLASGGANLVRISASSLGSGAFGTASPARPGFYQVKYIVAQTKAINRLAGRTLISWVKPDQITEADLRR